MALALCSSSARPLLAPVNDGDDRDGSADGVWERLDDAQGGAVTEIQTEKITAFTVQCVHDSIVT